MATYELGCTVLIVCMDSVYFVNCSNIIVISWFNFPVASCAVNCLTALKKSNKSNCERFLHVHLTVLCTLLQGALGRTRPTL